MSETGKSPRMQRGGPGVGAFASDLRFSARLLWKDRGVTIAAVLMLAAAIALNGTIFVIVRAVMVRGFPQVADNDRLVYIQESRDGQRMFSVFPADFRAWQDESTTVESLALVAALPPVILSELDAAESREPLTAYRVTWNLFHVAGVSPALGRER